MTTLDLLGAFRLSEDDKPLSLPISAQRLVAFLALRGGVLKRVYVAGMLWTEFSQDSAYANLRTTLWRLKRLSCPLVETTATHVSLAEGVEIDVRQMAAIVGRIAGRGAEFDEDLRELMLAGELLPDWYDDWVVIERERFRQSRLHALEALCVDLTGEGRYDRAIEAGLTAVAGEPLRESAHRAVMRAHLAEGNPSEALRQYELCRRLLDEQLGFKPSAETQQLRRLCAAGDAAVMPVR